MKQVQKDTLKVLVPLLVLALIIGAIVYYTNTRGNIISRQTFKRSVENHLADNYADKDFYIDYIDYRKTTEDSRFVAVIGSKSNSQVTFAVLKDPQGEGLIDNYYENVVLDRSLSIEFQRQVNEHLNSVLNNIVPYMETLNVYSFINVKKGEFSHDASVLEDGVPISSVFIFLKDQSVNQADFAGFVRRAIDVINLEGYNIAEYIISYCFNEVTINEGKYVYEGFEVRLSGEEINLPEDEIIKVIEDIHIDI